MKNLIEVQLLTVNNNGGRSQLHNAPPSPFLHQFSHNSDQLGDFFVEPVPDVNLVVEKIVVVEAVVVSGSADVSSVLVESVDDGMVVCLSFSLPCGTDDPVPAAPDPEVASMD